MVNCEKMSLGTGLLLAELHLGKGSLKWVGHLCEINRSGRIN